MSLLREYISEVLKTSHSRKRVHEVVSASKSYLRKEEIRQNLQDLIQNRVAEGSIRSQKDLDAFFADVKMASGALKNIPFEVFKKLAKK